MDGNAILGVVIIYLVGGLFTAAGIFNWDWFFERSRARSTVALFGRQGARYVYGITGIISLVIGTVVAFSG